MLENHLGNNGLALEKSSKKGRVIVARKNFSPGDIVLSCQPLAAVVDSSVLTSTCDQCFNPGENLNRCSACKFSHYCSREHQRIAWKDHQLECKVIGKIQRRPTTSIRLLFRLLQKRNVSVVPGNSFEDALRLESHWEVLPDDRKVEFAQMAMLVREMAAAAGLVSGREEQDYDLKLLARLFAIFQSNNHTICDAELRQIGIGLYPLAALVNHSCRPNCSQMFEGNTIVFRCIQPIAPADEVTISYIELLQTHSARDKALMQGYFFHCSCERCCPPAPASQDSSPAPAPGLSKEDALLEAFVCRRCKPAGVLQGPMMSDGSLGQGQMVRMCPTCEYTAQETDLAEHVRASENALREAEKLSANANDTSGSDSQRSEARRLMRGAIHQALTVMHMHPCNFHLLSLRQSLLQACIDIEDWQGALDQARALSGPYQTLYPTNSPLVALHYARLGRLEWLLGNTDEALGAFLKAQDTLRVTHGQNHALVQQIGSQVDEAKAEKAYRERSAGGTED